MTAESFNYVSVRLTVSEFQTTLFHTPIMSSIIGRAAFRATRPLRATGATIKNPSAAITEEREAGKKSLQQGARRDPELYVRPNTTELS